MIIFTHPLKNYCKVCFCFFFSFLAIAVQDDFAGVQGVAAYVVCVVVIENVGIDISGT